MQLDLGVWGWIKDDTGFFGAIKLYNNSRTYGESRTYHIRTTSCLKEDGDTYPG